MTMAPSRQKRGIWLELVFLAVLLFLLAGARSQSIRGENGESSVTHVNPVLSAKTMFR